MSSALHDSASSGTSMRKLGDRGIANTIGKKVTPILGRLVNGVRITRGVQLMTSYLDLLVGKGSGTGWDKGEEAAAANVLRKRGVTEPVVIDCGGNRGEWTREVRRRLG